MVHVLHYHKNPKLQLSGLKLKKKFVTVLMELAKWLVHWAPKLVSVISMMYVLHYHKNPKPQLSGSKYKKKSFLLWLKTTI